MQSSIHPATPGALDARPAASVGARDWSSTAKDLLQLTKPRVTWLVLITTACGALVAPGPIDWVRFAVAVLGVSLVVGSANAFNMYIERDSDAAMQRTRLRPLPAGRLQPEVAFWFAWLLAALGLAITTLLVNPMTGLLSFIALASYVLIYTPMKRVTPWALHIGAIPGAMPPLLGWASVTGSIDYGALTLFAILFVWQLPHFIAIAIFRQSDYEQAGLRVLPAVKGLNAAKFEIIVYSFTLLTVSLFPVWAGIAGRPYLFVAGALGALFAAWGVYGVRADAGARWARSLFFASMPYLVLVFGALVAAAG